jgi:hypothetical protein
MKKISFIVVFLIGYNYISCKKIDVVEQTVFDKIKTCYEVCDTTRFKKINCDSDYKLAYSDTYELKNVEGVMKVLYYDLTLVLTNPNSIVVDKKRFPLWNHWGYNFNPCNLPSQLKILDREVKVKFDCKLLYVPLPSLGLSVPQSDGYPVELTRIEIIQ